MMSALILPLLFAMFGGGWAYLYRPERRHTLLLTLILAELVTLLAYVFATAYSALDVISGIAAGFVTSRLPPGAARPAEVHSLFVIGTPLGHVGSVALVLAAALLTVDAVRRHGAPGAVGLLAVVGALMLHGSAGIALVGLGTGGLARIGTQAAFSVSPTGPPS